QGNLIVSLMIKKTATIGTSRQRPTLAMDNATGDMFIRFDIPKFFDTKSINLWLAVSVQREFLFQDFGKMTVNAFSKECVFRMKFQTWLIVRLVTSITCDAHITGGNAFNRTIIIVKNLGCGETGEDFNSHILSAFTQPSAKITKRSSIGSLVLHEAGKHKVRQFKFLRLGQHPMLVVDDGNSR